MNNALEKDLFDSLPSPVELDLQQVEEARQIFESYKGAGILMNCDFESETWKTTDEYSNVGFRFNFNTFTYKRYYAELLGISMSDFILYVKLYVISLFGISVLKTIQSMINDLKRIIKTNPEEIYGENADLHLAVPNRCIDFFTALPQFSEEQDIFASSLETYSAVGMRNGQKQRSLAQFDSYFLFNDILNDYWKSETDIEEKMFFYPLYLWWNITAVLPLRPREFILTQRNCLEKRADGYYLTIRRDNLKGNSDGKVVHYKIEADYRTNTYKIPDNLANDIRQYIKETSHYDGTDIDTLFIADPHYHKWGQKKHSNSRYLTYVNMNTIMRYFYRDVIEKKYKMTVVYDSEYSHLGENQINYIHLGDTRHLALINIIAEGGTPVLAMLLAGHSNMEMAAHYYSNISNLIECRTYRQYRLVMQGEVSYQVSSTKALPTRAKYVRLTDDSLCYSEKYRNHDFSDCMSAVGKRGEIGYCPSCPYNRSQNEMYFHSDNVYRRKIEDDCKALTEAIRVARIGNGATEGIMEAMLRLKSSSYDYQQYCQEKLDNERNR